MKNSLNKKIALHGEIAEIKRIYSAIKSSLLKKNPACLVITSAVPREGKTIIAAGLAAYAARQNNERVLAMDLNWYSPALHQSFGLDLTFKFDALKRGASILDFVKPSGLENLDILTAVQPSEGSEVSFGETDAHAVFMIKKARENYSFVVVDTSPMFRPKPPRQGGAVLLERLGRLWTRLSSGWRMVLRSTLRNHTRTATGVFAAAMGAAILVSGFMMSKATVYLIDFQFRWVQRSDIDLVLRDEHGADALDE
ncbi:MAG: hypothetical protein R6X10_02395, partial [Desulfobacterales bacterium]